MSELTIERRGAIVALLELLNKGLPEPPAVKSHAQSGFVDTVRPRTCPDCLANGRPMIGCETCRGSGVVPLSRLASIAAPDALPDDGDPRDPYAVTGKEKTIGYAENHDRRVALDSAISRAGEGLRRFGVGRALNTEEEIAEANRQPYVWERERAELRRRYDFRPMLQALDALREHDPAGSSLLHSVYVYGITEPSTTLEAVIDRALGFLHGRLPDPLRAPGFEVKHPALDRRDRKAAA